MMNNVEKKLVNQIQVQQIFSINGHTKVYFELPEDMFDKKHVHEWEQKDAHGRAVLEERADGLYTYGYYSHKGSYGHGPEYRWSSRCEVINKVFGTDVVDITINNMGCYACRYDVFVAICQKHNIQALPDTDGIDIGWPESLVL